MATSESSLLERGVLAGLALFCVPSLLANPVVQIDSNGISIESDSVSVRSILESLSLACGMHIRSELALDDRITLSITDRSANEVVHRLLRKRNYLYLQIDDSCGELIISAPRTGADESVWQTVNRNQKVLALAAAEDAAPLVAALFADPDAAVREEAVQSLAELDDERALGTLRYAINDPSSRIQLAAIEEIAGIGGQDATAIFAEALSGATAANRLAIADELADIEGDDAQRLLEVLSRDAFGAVAETARQYLDERTDAAQR